MNPEITIFMDMDGVLARYDRHAYDRARGPAPGIALFEHEPSHYFRRCSPDTTAIAMLNKLLSPGNGTKTYVMTSIATHIPWAASDKKAWLEKYCPNLNIERQFVISSDGKAETAMGLLGMNALDENTILLDDFNENLESWAAHGGKAIKYLNGVNDASSWNGPAIDGRNNEIERISTIWLSLISK